jgi:hypothetical protein
MPSLTTVTMTSSEENKASDAKENKAANATKANAKDSKESTPETAPPALASGGNSGPSSLSSEPVSGLLQAVQIAEKKVRNLEKRKVSETALH